MKTKPFTKEQLQKQLDKIRDSHTGWVEGDERRRKEFAKAFAWYEDTSYSYSTRECKTPTWVEIFIQLGKLLNFNDETQSLGDIHLRLDTLERINQEREDLK